MRYRRLGNSDLEVSEISLGSWLTFGSGVPDEQARACVEQAFASGINFIDTANVYGKGKAEEFLGEVLEGLAGRPRESYVLATKLYFPMDSENRGLSRKQVHTQLEGSLRRLKTDYVDLYQAHRYDEATPLEETLQAFDEVVQEGKVRYLGFSEWSAEQIESALRLQDENGWARFVSSQPQYSLLHRYPERDVIPLCREEGVSQIVWSPLGQGVLTGKYRPGEPLPEGSRADSQAMGWAIGRLLNEENVEAVERLRPLARECGLSLAQLALAWVLRERNVASAIIGASRPEQVEENARASGIELSGDVLQEIDDALGPSVIIEAGGQVPV